LKGSFLSVVGMVVIIYSLITVLAATALSLTVDSVRGPPFCFFRGHDFFMVDHQGT
jgi:hypothetical protein